MLSQLVVLSGRVTAGKTTLAELLVSAHSFVRFSTRELLISRLGADAKRTELQAIGADLDRQTNGSWVRDELAKRLEGLPDARRVIIDAVRIEPQIERLREAFGERVVHIHLIASRAELERRYALRSAGRADEMASYDAVSADPTEASVDDLATLADIVISSERSTPEDVLVRACSGLGLHGSAQERLVDILVGGQYGSEGKGNIAFYLGPEYEVLMRVGGPNAGHKVMPWTGSSYTHHQLPSGRRANPLAHLVIGPGATINVGKLLDEIADCEVEYGQLSIDPQAMVIEDADIAEEAQKLKETIGSTAQGVGVATMRKIGRGKDGPVTLAGAINELKPYVRPTAEVLEGAYLDRRRILLEGTQGTGLSLHHGAYPYVTSRDTTAAGCMAEAGIPPGRVRKVVMVCRTYPIRVEDPPGRTSGPMSQEITWATVEGRANMPSGTLDKVEKTSTTGRRRRVGEFDWVQLRRSALLNSPTDVALTFADYLAAPNSTARRFEQLDDVTLQFIGEVERVAQAPVSLISTRFHSRSVIDRRLW